MQTAITPTGHEDGQAVEAVRRGDADRYRELVERHERRVFAVAWSRLGDASLAEEATQEAFIRGYRHLALLGEGAKFSPWITAIVRHVAISLGLRHRRELTKRERWALEQTPTTEPAREETELCTPETLRQTLAELPAAHRECLVLFYFEGKSGAEAADALGISEAALRVRLHRARAALRERLEEHLAESLGQLRPARPIAPSVMGAILSFSTAKATGGTGVGIGATILSALGKVLPFKFIMSFFWVVGLVPSLAFTWWVGRLERRNYRDAEGFRPRLHREFYRRQLWIIAAIMFVSWGIVFPIIRLSDRLFGYRMYFLVIGLLTVVITLPAARLLAINRSRFQISIVAYGFLLVAGELAIGVGLLPTYLLSLFLALATLLLAATFGDRPLRMDYSLFLRAAQGMLRVHASKTPDEENAVQLDASELRAFARFLGTRWLVTDYRWGDHGLELRLSGPKQNNFMIVPFFWRGCSSITLGEDGEVSAHLGEKDEQALRSLQGHAISSPAELEAEVASAVELGWHCFREGDLPSAERALGQVPDSEVFVVPTKRSKATRGWIWLTMGSAALMLVLVALMHWRAPFLGGLKPVSVTETEIRAALASLADNASTNRSMDGDLMYGLTMNCVLPPTNCFTPDALQAVRREIFKSAGFDPHSDGDSKFISLRDRSYLNRAMLNGWIDWNDVGLKPQDVAEYIHQHQSANELQFKLEFLLARSHAWSWVDNKGWYVERINDFTLNQLRWLRTVNCLDLVDREQLIRQIASVQVLSGTPPGQPPIHDWRDVRGLFFTPCWPALQDTYFSVAVLEILDGLDKIDREACIEGILKRHRGKGFFTSPDSGGYNEYHIDGSARDTIAAFESLRILGALDRVKDLDHWQFRPLRASNPGAPRKVSWDEIEAWLCQQRLGRVLREHREHPQAPVRSLLEP